MLGKLPYSFCPILFEEDDGENLKGNEESLLLTSLVK